MLQQRLISIEDMTQWQAELDDMPHAAAHTWAYNQAIMQSSKLQTYLYCATAPNFKAICPLSLREKGGKIDIVTPYGFGGYISRGQHPDIQQAWQQFMISQKYVCGYIALHPVFDQINQFQTNEVNTHSTTYVLNLTQPLMTLDTQLSKSHRYELRQWQDSGVELITDSLRLIDALPMLYHETLMRVKASQVYHFSLETLISLVNNNHSIILGAAVNQKIEAISLFLYSPHIADYFLNASTELGRRHTRGLLWEGLKQLKQLNIPFLNLGGGIKSQDNLENFKRRFGGSAYPYYVLKQIYDQSSFAELCQQSGILPANQTYFPPYHAGK